MSENLKLWDNLRTPPKEALKAIKGGRLNGMTDISPQWRYKAMTEQFGPIGIGWGYNIKELWIEKCDDGTACAFSKVSVWYKLGDVTSEDFDGIGGSMLVAKESSGLRTSDECYKMATTDALSVALKMIGVGADVYSGTVSHDSKYSIQPEKQYVNKHEDDSKKNEQVAKDCSAMLLSASNLTELDKAMKEVEGKWNSWPDAWIDKMNKLFVEREKALKDK